MRGMLSSSPRRSALPPNPAVLRSSKTLVRLGSILLATACGAPERAAPPPPVADAALRAALRPQLERLGVARDGTPLAGRDGWLFLTAEARYLATDRFWGRDADRASGGDDPLEVVVDFARQLRERGADLLFVPVPPKLALEPGELLDGLPATPVLIDAATPAFLRALAERGIAGVDLYPAFFAARRAGGEPLATASDSHWSPRGCRVAAAEVARVVRERWPGLAGPRPDGPEPAAERHAIPGDLRELLPEPRPARETLTFYPAQAGSPDRPGEAGGPIRVLGDSHVLVYRTRRSGFTDHLERDLGEPIDQLGVEAGGPTGARQALARRPDLLAGRKLVVWISAARLFVAGPPWLRVELPPAAGPRE
jgi:alginate O-acetyltransferase complex protein AlgJ